MLFLFVLALELLLLLLAILATQRVRNSIVVCFHGQTGFIIKADGQIRTELGYLEEMDARLAYHLIYEHMVQVILLNHFTLFIYLIVEDIKGEAIAFGENLVN